MNIQDMSTINLMKKNVAGATLESIDALCAEIPMLIQYSEASPREIKLELLEVAKSIIDKMEELLPEVIEQEGWVAYADTRTKLAEAIMVTRFAL